MMEFIIRALVQLLRSAQLDAFREESRGCLWPLRISNRETVGGHRPPLQCGTSLITSFEMRKGGRQTASPTSPLTHVGQQSIFTALSTNGLIFLVGFGRRWIFHLF